MAKNKWVAAVLSFFIAGLGQAYLGLYKRFVVQFVIVLILSFLVFVIGSLSTFLCLIWSIYTAYDALQCTDAINNNQAIPAFLGQDLQ